MKVSKKLRASLPRHDISIPFKFGELLGGHCSFLSTWRHFSWRHCWETRAMRVEPHASCWIWQQSVALFNELWEQKLLNNFHLQHLLFATTLTLTLRHSDVIVV